MGIYFPYGFVLNFTLRSNPQNGGIIYEDSNSENFKISAFRNPHAVHVAFMHNGGAYSHKCRNG